jgi:hypothetical protein
MSRAPSFVEIPAPGSRRVGEWSVLVVLIVLLATQLFLSERGRLSASTTWRPVVSAICDIARCTLPAWHEPDAFAMLSRDVIAVPDRPGVLRVQASIRNDARWPQPWPTLVLRLSDADGRLLGSRRFTARDYLGRSPDRAILQAGQSAQLAFDIIEPAPGVVAFDFRFE